MNVLEGKFSEVELPIYGVLGSSLPASNAKATAKITHLGDTPTLPAEYAALVTWKEDPT
jgi:hypothetical protein